MPSDYRLSVSVCIRQNQNTSHSYLHFTPGYCSPFKMRHSVFLKSVFIWYDQTHLLKGGFNDSARMIDDSFLDCPLLLWRESYEMLVLRW
jgi:hypothetical protein